MDNDIGRKREEEKEKETKEANERKGVGNEGRKKEEKIFIFPSKSFHCGEIKKLNPFKSFPSK